MDNMHVLQADSSDHVTTPPLLGESADLSDLAWIIPTTIVCIFAMVGIAFACYYGVRRLENHMIHWCYDYCSCCCSPDEEQGRLLRGEQYDRLSLSQSTERKEAVNLKEFRVRAPSYGVTRDTHEEYVPRRTFNPFDD